jgi:hypothetical protein
MQINQLTATPHQCQKLIKLGITAPSAVFWHAHEEDGTQPNNDDGSPAMRWGTAMYLQPKISETMVPAWTKEELDLMIGPDWPKPDIWETKAITGATDPLTYPIAYPDKMVVFKTGSQASADALLTLLEKGKVDPVEASQRLLYRLFPELKPKDHGRKAVSPKSERNA